LIKFLKKKGRSAGEDRQFIHDLPGVPVLVQPVLSSGGYRRKSGLVLFIIFAPFRKIMVQEVWYAD
jgi:hypothetical protein